MPFQGNEDFTSRGNTTRMTAHQFLQLGEDPVGVRLELVDGKVAVSQSQTPAHSRIVVQMTSVLANHIDSKGLGELFYDLNTILDADNVRRPDLLFCSKDHLDLIGDKAMEGAPDLAIEVLSPSSVKTDRVDKFKQYQKAGVMHYWIIDPQEQRITVLTLDGTTYREHGVFVPGTVAPSALLPGFSLPVDKVLAF